MNSIEKKRVIDLEDLFIYYLRKWKILLILLLAMLIVSVGLTHITNHSAQSVDAQIKAYKLVLTSEEQKETENIAALIKDYREKNDLLIEYNEKSIYQNIDSHNAPTVELTYYIDDAQSIDYSNAFEGGPTASLVTSYADIVNSEELLTIISKDIDKNIELNYLAELFVTNIESAKVGYLKVTVYGSDIKMAKQLAEVANKEILSHNAKFSETISNHTIKLVSQNVFYSVSDEMTINQQNVLDKISSNKTSIVNAEKMLTGAQSDYLNLLIHEQKDESVSLQKNVLLFLVVGFGLYIVTISIYYLFSSVIINSVELKKIYRNTYFAIALRNKKYNNLLNKIRNRKIVAINSDTNCKLIAKKIENCLKENKGKGFCISIDNCDNEMEEIIDKIISNISQQIEIVKIGNILSESNDLDKALQYENILFVINENKTKFSTLEKENCICEENCVNILGILAIR